MRYRAEREVALQADRAKTEFLAIDTTNCERPERRDRVRRVDGGAEILGPLAPRYLEYATDIMSSGQHLLSVINDILDMSQIESGMQPLTAEATDLASLIEAAVKLVALRATAEAGAEVNLVALDVPVTRVDTRAAVAAVLLNLLERDQVYAVGRQGGRALQPQSGGVDCRRGRGQRSRHRRGRL